MISVEHHNVILDDEVEVDEHGQIQKFDDVDVIDDEIDEVVEDAIVEIMQLHIEVDDEVEETETYDEADVNELLC